jgi:nicotinamide mononucleotide transporter
MSHVFDFLFSQYSGYTNLNIAIEVIAILFSLFSVIYSLKNKVLVFPTGIISTLLYVYLLFKWGLLGDMIVSAYYFVMSVYGWYVWTKKIDETEVTPISYTNKKEHFTTLFIFISTMFFIYIVYHVFGKWNDWTAYVDTLTTGLFFVGMWLMAKRKIENWIYLLIGDLISVPLYFYKGYTLSSILYVIFTIIAIFGYLEWKKNLDKTTIRV